MKQLKEADEDGWLTKMVEDMDGEVKYQAMEKVFDRMSKEELVEHLNAAGIQVSMNQSKDEMLSMTATRLEDMGFKANYSAEATKRTKKAKEDPFLKQDGNFKSPKAKTLHALTMEDEGSHRQAELLGIDHGTKAQKIAKLDTIIDQFATSTDPVEMGAWVVAKKLKMQLEG